MDQSLIEQVVARVVQKVTGQAQGFMRRQANQPGHAAALKLQQQPR